MKRKAVVDLDDTKKERKRDEIAEAQDNGHRYGNYHNYYTFHPPAHRLDKMKDILEYIGTKYEGKDGASFEYCDLGCNEGDLTIEIASTIQQQFHTRVHFVGVDMDPILIERAEKKHINNQSIVGEFQVGNICETLDEMLKNKSIDMTSLFSTTMWIHLHAGDEGLRTVLKLICQKTRQFLLIEPQPSKCYRMAQKRLRKLGRPEIDISSDRLKLRPNIEKEIDFILRSNCFEKVSCTSSERTEWNRSLQLYERKS